MEKRKFKVITLIADIVILAISFLVMVWSKPASLRHYLPTHAPFFAGLAIMWIIVSLLNGKMHRGKIVNFTSLFYRVIASNIIAVAITALAMYSVRDMDYSRTIVLGTALLATVLELLFGAVYIAYKKAVVQDYEEYEKYKSYKKPSEYELVSGINGVSNDEPVEVNPNILNALEKECGPDISQAVIKMTGPKLTEKTAVLSTTTIFNITSLAHDKYEYIINLHKINDIKKTRWFYGYRKQQTGTERIFFLLCGDKRPEEKEIAEEVPASAQLYLLLR